MKHIDFTLKDYASWDDTYNFMSTRDPDFTDANLNLTNFEDLSLSSIIMLNNENQIIWYDFSLADVISKNKFVTRIYPCLLQEFPYLTVEEDGRGGVVKIGRLKFILWLNGQY